MIRAAIIIDGRVDRVILLTDLAEHPGAVDGTTASAGDLYDAQTGRFSAPPLPPEAAQELRELRRADINTWRDEQEAAGIVFDHADRLWDGGLVVRARLTPLQALPELPAGFFWTDAEDNDVPMTAADLHALHAAHEMAIVARGFEIHVRQRQMKAEIDAMNAEQLGAFVPDWQQDEGGAGG